MSAGAPLIDYRVLPEWVDYNGHMGDFAYGIIFSRAVTELMGTIGLGESYRATSGATLYTLEMRIGYLRECHEGDRLSVSTRVLGCDEKRMHVYLEMLDAGGARLAWCEQVLLHVARSGGKPRAAPFPPATAAALALLQASQRDVERPVWLGRRTGL